MSQIEFKALLDADTFPFLPSSMSRTILLRDGQENGRLYTQQASDTKPPLTPQIMYMENCVPTVAGVQSVGYRQFTPPYDGIDLGFTSRYEIRTPRGNKFEFAISNTTGQAYLLDPTGSGIWAPISLPGAITWVPGTQITIAYVQGTTYICLAKLGVIYLDDSTGVFPFQLTQLVLTGIDVSKIICACGAANYLIISDMSTVYWSSATTPSDFTPSLTTGADSSNVSDIKGNITFLAQIPQGFLIYTNTNVVSATYTSNLRYPWNFREVPGSAGVIDPEQVSYDENFAEHIAWTNSGLMKLNRIEATIEFPEVTDFLAGRRYETFDWTAGQIIVSMLTSNLHTKINMVGSRYLIVSYGIFSLTDALIYDYSLKRWGRLKIDHVDVFEYSAPTWVGARRWRDLHGIPWRQLHPQTWKQLRSQERIVGVPKHNVCFMKADGSVYVLNGDLSDDSRSGVLLLGKYQYVRSRILDLFRVECEDVTSTATNYSCKIFSSWDGKTLNVQTSPYVRTPVLDGIRDHLCRVSGINHIIGFNGAFNLNSVMLTAKLGGSRQ